MNSPHIHNNFSTFYGMPVIKNHHIPAFKNKIELSAKVQVSYEFRVQFNLFLKDFFGEEACVFIIDDKFLMHPDIQKNLIK